MQQPATDPLWRRAQRRHGCSHAPYERPRAASSLRVASEPSASYCERHCPAQCVSHPWWNRAPKAKTATARNMGAAKPLPTGRDFTYKVAKTKTNPLMRSRPPDRSKFASCFRPRRRSGFYLQRCENENQSFNAIATARSIKICIMFSPASAAGGQEHWPW